VKYRPSAGVDQGQRSVTTTMNSMGTRGLIAVDKMGGKVLFLAPDTYATTHILDDFERLPHELLVPPQSPAAYIPIYGDGIHGRNPNPGHLLSVVDLETRRHVIDIDLSPYVAPHGLQIGPDGLLYITCENSGVVALVDLAKNAVVGAIETGSVNSHRLAIAPNGRWLYTENEEDASISVIDLPGRRLVRQVATPHPLAGLAISPGGKLLVAVDDEEPVLVVIDTASFAVVRTVPLDGVPEPAQIARYSPDGEILLVTSLRSATATLMDPTFGDQITLAVGQQPMDGAFHEGSLFVACQGDGSIHVIDLATRRVSRRFEAGVGCETLAFF
jgi:DNA-binding beta-propeller fold protein YncE